jgi:beta-glucosidase
MNTANKSRYPGLPADTDASIQALAAGVDQDLSGYSFSSLLPATQQGLVPTPTSTAPHGIDVAVANVLRAKFAAGLFDQPFTDPALLATVDSAAHRQLAKDVIIDGATLLQNSQSVLPKSVSDLAGKKVAVVGPLAACRAGEAMPCTAQMAMAGGYVTQPTDSQIVTVAEALGNRLPAGTLQVVAGTGDAAGVAKAAAAAKAADLVLVVVGDRDGDCGESEDRMELDLVGNQVQCVVTV